MSLPEIVSAEEWRAARVALDEEKAATRARDALSTRRRELPMVRIAKDYRFEGPRAMGRTGGPPPSSFSLWIRSTIEPGHQENGCGLADRVAPRGGTFSQG